MRDRDSSAVQFYSDLKLPLSGCHQVLLSYFHRQLLKTFAASPPACFPLEKLVLQPARTFLTIVRRTLLKSSRKCLKVVRFDELVGVR